MKKVYEVPTVEKIAFNYREQVVAASGVTDMPGTPSIGQLTNETWGQNGCKLYALEAYGIGICSYA